MICSTRLFRVCTLCCLLSIFVPVPTLAIEKVSLQLKWSHQFQFAGYYAAIEQGYYSDAGLEVTVLERVKGMDLSTEIVLAGDATYGVGGTDTLISRLNGESTVALAAIFQHSPIVGLTLSETNIATAKDLAGKRIMAGAVRYEFPAMLHLEGMTQKDVTWLPNSFKIQSLINREIDIYSAYITDQPYSLIQQNIPFNVIRPANYGVDFYGDILFTTEDEIVNHSGRTAAFVKASIRGWEYAINHPDEIVDIIIQKYNSKKSREHLLYEAQETIKLIAPNHSSIGHINKGRLEHIAKLLQQLGHVQTTEKLAGFLFKKEPPIIAGLTEKEKQWLNQNNEVRVRVADAPPMIFMADGSIKGIAAEYLNIIQDLTGISYIYNSPPPPWSQSIQGIMNHTGPDLIPAIRSSKERAQFIDFTDHYIDSPTVLFTQKDTEHIDSLPDLAGHTITVPKGHLLQEVIENNYPEIQISTVSSVKKCLEAVSMGAADACGIDILLGSYHTRLGGFTNLQISAPVPVNNPRISMAVRSDWPELTSIIDKILDQIPLEQHNEIKSKWHTINYTDKSQLKKEIAKWFIPALLSLLVVIVWNYSLITQINKRKKTEQLLRESDQRFRTVLNHSASVIFNLNLFTRTFEYVSPSSEEILGHNATFIKSSGPALFNQFVHADNRGTLQDHLQSIPSASSQHHSTDIFYYNHPVHGSRWMQVSRTVLFDETRTAKAIIANILDITEQKNNEEKVRQYSNQLEEIIEMRTAELRKVQQRLINEEKLSALGKLSGSIAHDIRNPLGVISNSVFFIKSCLSDITKEKLNKHLLLMEKEIETANTIITDLLDFSKGNTQKWSRFLNHPLLVFD